MAQPPVETPGNPDEFVRKNITIQQRIWASAVRWAKLRYGADFSGYVTYLITRDMGWHGASEEELKDAARRAQAAIIGSPSDSASLSPQPKTHTAPKRRNAERQ